MNCFHIQYLWYYTTTNPNCYIKCRSLWIAFIFSTFGITQQLFICIFFLYKSCELLSYSVPLVLHNNAVRRLNICYVVVNCFHIQYLWYYTTTASDSTKLDGPLWIAFIFSTFGITQQLLAVPVSSGCRCELLSYSVPLVLHNNSIEENLDCDKVVNCFHIQYLWYYTTTYIVLPSFSYSLWIAFIFSTFGITQQQNHHSSRHPGRCELLSYSVPLVLHNNSYLLCGLTYVVVNCFHIQYLWYYTTTLCLFTL